MPAKTDEDFMRATLSLAAKGGLGTLPNPQVGALVVREGQVVGRGYHTRAGTPHAEVLAIREAGEAARDATLYVNLEPCSHHGRTPPCTEAILRAQIRRVVAAHADPDPRVAGQGFAALRRAGIRVDAGLERAAAERLNEVYLKHRRTGHPFVLLKAAVTLDGKTATRTGDAHWISGERSREQVHRLRSEYPAILIGSGTVHADDPRLSARPLAPGKRQPLRVVLDSRGSISPTARCLPANSEGAQPTLVCTTDMAPRQWMRSLEDQGAEIAVLPSAGGRVALGPVFALLGDRDLCGVLTEAGARLNSALLSGGRIDKLLVFMAPRILGGTEGVPGLFAGPGPELLSGTHHVRDWQWAACGEDLVVSGYPERPKQVADAR